MMLRLLFARFDHLLVLALLSGVTSMAVAGGESWRLGDPFGDRYQPSELPKTVDLDLSLHVFPSFHAERPVDDEPLTTTASESLSGLHLPGFSGSAMLPSSTGLAIEPVRSDATRLQLNLSGFSVLKLDSNEDVPQFRVRRVKEPEMKKPLISFTVNKTW